MSTFVLTDPFVPPILEHLDPEPVTLTLPSGMARTLTKTPNSDSLSGSERDPNMPLFVGNPGETYTFAGTGSAQVGVFRASLTLPPVFNVAGMSSVSDISRNQNLDLMWTGGDPNYYVVVTGTSSRIRFLCPPVSSSSTTTFYP